MLIGKILVLARRDLKKWSKSRFSLAWVVLRPLPWLLLFGKSLDPSKFLGDVSGSTQQQTEASLRATLSGAPDYFSFMAIGMLSVMVMTLSMLSMGSIVFDRYTGFLDKVLASPARRETILLSKVVASVTRGIIQALALFLVALALGMQTGPGFGIFEAIEAFAVLVVLGTGMSSIFVSIGARIKRWEAQEAIATAVTFPIMIDCIVEDTDDEAIMQACRYKPRFMQAQIDHYAPHATDWAHTPGYEAWQRIFAGMEERTRPEGIVPWCEWQLIGSAETVLRRLRAYLDVGFNHIILHFATPGIPVDVRHDWATRFARDVAPHVSPRLPAGTAVSGGTL